MSTSYAAALAALQQALISGDDTIALELVGRKTPSLKRRLGTYISGYRLRLEKVLQANYPATRAYLGDAAWAALTAEHISAHPSTSYTIDDYPHAFADFLRARAPAPIAALAQLESAISEVFWLADSAPFMPPPTLSAEALQALTLRRRTAMKLLALDYDAAAALHAFRQDAQTPPLQKKPTYLCVLRHQHEVKRYALRACEYALLQELNGQPFGEVLESFTSHNQACELQLLQHLQPWLKHWVEAGYLVNV